MTGAMAGSTTTLHRDISDRLQVITLTINNRCNLRCPHCYLQYDGPAHGVDAATLDAIVGSSARHIAIVGKEPLVDARSIAVTEDLVARCAVRGKSVSLVTNGLGLHRLSATTLATLEWIDVSLDGGPSTYSSYRRGNFAWVLRNVRESIERGARFINALHTVSSLNLANINDMMLVSELTAWNKIIFSPYVEVRNHGENATSPVPLAALLGSLSKSESFLNHPSAFLLIGNHAFSAQGADDQVVARDIEAAGLSSKVFRVEHDPLRLGYVRVTYDGYVMTPYQSLHPADYRAFATLLQQHASIDAAFQYLRAA